jgi:hypothetical protein
MKTRNIKNYMLVVGMALALFACQPEEYSLEPAIAKENLAYSITQKEGEPNMVILKSMTADVAPVWSTPIGRSFMPTDTLRFPFPGEYKFVYGAESAGGFVQDDTVTVPITTYNFTYLEHPYWDFLTGGAGESKSWVLDVDENGVSKVFDGPLYFAGPEFSWEWAPSWQSWAMPAGPYGTMTFSLVGAPSFSADNLVTGEQATGTFMLFPDDEQLQVLGAHVLTDGVTGAQGARVDDWNAKMMIRSLTENTLQLILVVDGGTLWETWNYVAKDYYDSL